MSDIPFWFEPMSSKPDEMIPDTFSTKQGAKQLSTAATVGAGLPTNSSCGKLFPAREARRGIIYTFIDNTN